MIDNDLLGKFLGEADYKQLFFDMDPVLVAVSGGLDSMVMLDLFRRSGMQIAVAHCNFGLRDSESDADMEFVRESAASMQVPFFTQRFDTMGYAGSKKISVQMAARELRYDWFEKIRSEKDYAYVATAHHRNDAVETMLLNLIKGTGMQGLTGIRSKSGNVVRPLLFAYRDELEAYAQEHKISFREDQSNASDNYQRNFLRNRIMPLIREINPAADRTLGASLTRFENIGKIYRQGLMRLKNELVHFDPSTDGFKISMLEMAGRQIDAEILYELIKEFDFNFSQAEDMLEAIGNQPGALFYSPTHVMVSDRAFFLIRPIDEPLSTRIELSEEDVVNNNAPALSFEVISAGAEITPDPAIAYLDMDQLSFPLLWRSREEGDQFIPLGMRGKKLVSDFLIDSKVPRLEKDEVHVLVSGEKIAWIAGYRIDDRFKVTEKTSRILKITL